MRTYVVALVAVMLGAGLFQAQGFVDVSSPGELSHAQQLAAEGQVDEALAAYLALSASQPDSAMIHSRIGGMYLLKQDYAASITHFQRAIGLDAEGSSEAFIGLGIAYLHQGNYGPARAALGEARRLKPESTADLDALVSWLDARRSATGVVHSELN